MTLQLQWKTTSAYAEGLGDNEVVRVTQDEFGWEWAIVMGDMNLTGRGLDLLDSQKKAERALVAVRTALASLVTQYDEDE